MSHHEPPLDEQIQSALDALDTIPPRGLAEDAAPDMATMALVQCRSRIAKLEGYLREHGSVIAWCPGHHNTLVRELLALRVPGLDGIENSPAATEADHDDALDKAQRRIAKLEALLNPDECTCNGEGLCDACLGACTTCHGDALNGCAACADTGRRDEQRRVTVLATGSG